MSAVSSHEADDLAANLITLLGADCVIDADDQLALFSSDIYSRGETASLVISPTDRLLLAPAVKMITDAGFAVFPRGGGMSYTGGYIPTRAKSVVVDTSRLTEIV